MHGHVMSTKPITTVGTADTAAPAQPKLRYVPKPKGSWKKVVGSMKDCDLFPEAMKLGAEWRARMNREGR